MQSRYADTKTTKRIIFFVAFGFSCYIRKYNIFGSPRWLHVINAPPCYLTSAYNNMESSLILLLERRVAFFLLYQKTF